MDAKEAIEKGYRWYCLGCHKTFRRLRVERYEDGHGGGYLEMCRCGSDLFGELKTLRVKGGV